MDNMSALGRARLYFVPPLPDVLKHLHEVVYQSQPVDAQDDALESYFPLTWGKPVIHLTQGKKRHAVSKRVGVVFSGGQAAGGHNIICGLFDALKALHADSQLFGFLGGPSGIVEGRYKELTRHEVALYCNQGGFDMIGSGRTKIELEEQLQKSLEHVSFLNLDALVVVGGDDSNTNAAILAEYFKKMGCKTGVIGTPKTIDGDLQNEYVEISFGFDTACRTYAELIGNIERDALSAKKYTHFIKLMGRSASHIALECALQTHPNVTIIGEEVAALKKTLGQITKELADVIILRAASGKNYGTILVPEGLIEFIPEIALLVSELNRLLVQYPEEEVTAHLSPEALSCYSLLPKNIQKQLLKERDPHGNLQVALIETEKLLIEMVSAELKARGFTGSFNPLAHSFGYEGRSALPSNFDATYCYVLGHSAALLIQEGLSGYLCFVQNLREDVSEWKVGGVPLTSLLVLEERKGKRKPVIRKALVDLYKKPFRTLVAKRGEWAAGDCYRFPGPIQFFGDKSITDLPPLILG